MFLRSHAFSIKHHVRSVQTQNSIWSCKVPPCPKAGRRTAASLQDSPATRERNRKRSARSSSSKALRPALIWLVLGELPSYLEPFNLKPKLPKLTPTYAVNPQPQSPTGQSWVTQRLAQPHSCEALGTDRPGAGSALLLAVFMLSLLLALCKVSQAFHGRLQTGIPFAYPSCKDSTCTGKKFLCICIRSFARSLVCSLMHHYIYSFFFWFC